MVRFVRVLICALGAMTLMCSVAVARANPNPGIFPPHSSPYRIGYREWAADWFEWAFEAPTSASPVLNPSICGPGESSHAWMLGVSVGGAETATCTVPKGKAIFVTPGGGFCSVKTDHVTGYRALRRCAIGFAAGATKVRLTVDGRRVRDIDNYYQVSRLIHLRLPKDNLFGVSAGADPAVVAGWFFLLRPLRPGDHTIVASDVIPPGPASVTFHIHVGS